MHYDWPSLLTAALTSIGVAVLLVWAGFVEAFLSQYHEPVIPYSAKIAFGLVELVLLCLFLAKSGSQSATDEPTTDEHV